MLLKRNSSDDSSAESVAIDHSWSTAAARRSKRKLNTPEGADEAQSSKKISRRSSHQSLQDVQSETPSASGEDSDEECASGSDEEENSRVSRRGYMSIPSFSFLNGTYRFYDATLHRIEDAGSAMYHDASEAINSASKSVSQSSSVLYHAVRDTIETVVHDLVTTDGVDVDDEAPVEPITPRRRTKAAEPVSAGVRRSRRQSVGGSAGAVPASPEVAVSKSRAASAKKTPRAKRS